MKRGEKRGEREEERRGEVKRKEKRREASPARFVHLDRGICVWFVGLDWRRRCRQVSISGMGRARAAPSFSSSWYSYATASTNCCSSQTPQLSYISRSTCTLILYQLLLYRFFLSIFCIDRKTRLWILDIDLRYKIKLQMFLSIRKYRIDIEMCMYGIH